MFEVKKICVELQAVQQETHVDGKLVRHQIEEYKKENVSNVGYNKDTRIFFVHKLWYIQDFGEVLADIKKNRAAIQKEIHGFKQVNTELAGMVEAVIDSLNIKKQNSDGEIAHITQREVGNSFGVSERSVREHSKPYKAFYTFGTILQPIKKLETAFLDIENIILDRIKIK